ncbi:mechanosensitive ion channel family protein [Desulfocurvus sp. DL9XJH121]
MPWDSSAGAGVDAWLAAAALFVAGFGLVRVGGWLYHAVLTRWCRAKGVEPDEAMAAALDSSIWWLAWGLGLFAGMTRISFPSGLHGPLLTLLLCLSTFVAISVGFNLLRLGLDLSLKRRGTSLAEHGSRAFLPVVKAAAWLLAGVFLLDNMGFKVSTLLAGLGVAGVAVGFAAQAVLGDLFSYFAILFDRPFSIGDFITMGEHMGTIEHIGLKTTRIRSLGGEQIVLPNSDLTGSRVRNYRRMTRRRVCFGLGVVYQTPAEVLEALPGVIREVVEATDRATFDRAHFQGFGASSLDFEVVFYVEAADYTIYMDVLQAINLGIVRAFEERGVAFAYPTRTLFMAREKNHA